jgi:hypothetical protein
MTDLLETCGAAATNIGADGGEILMFYEYNGTDLPSLFVSSLLYSVNIKISQVAMQVEENILLFVLFR